MSTLLSVDAILKQNYSEEFDTLRKNAIALSYYKYGAAKINFTQLPDGSFYVDAIKTLEMCLQKFKETGNTEYLRDVANYAMFRYMYPATGEYFKSTSSEESCGVYGMAVNEVKNFKDDNKC